MPPWPMLLALVTRPVMPERPLPMVTGPAVAKVPPLLRRSTPLVPSQFSVVIPAKIPPLSICNPPPLPRVNVVLKSVALVRTSHAWPPVLLEIASVPRVKVTARFRMSVYEPLVPVLLVR